MPKVSSCGSLVGELAAVVWLELVGFEAQLAKTLAAVNDKTNKDALLKNDLLSMISPLIISSWVMSDKCRI